jgi:sodium/potassium-transporting ATPase subunit alpha
MYFGFASEIILSCLVAYCVPLNLGLGTRDVTFIHYGVGAMPFGLIIIKARKFMVNIT